MANGNPLSRELEGAPPVFDFPPNSNLKRTTADCSSRAMNVNNQHSMEHMALSRIAR